MSSIRNYALNIHNHINRNHQRDNMNQNRRTSDTSDSEFAALFPDSIIVNKRHSDDGTIKFPHTRERKIFSHLLTMHRYIVDHKIINPKYTHTRFHPNEWLLEWNLEEQE